MTPYYHWHSIVLDTVICWHRNVFYLLIRTWSNLKISPSLYLLPQVVYKWWHRIDILLCCPQIVFQIITLDNKREIAFFSHYDPINFKKCHIQIWLETKSIKWQQYRNFDGIIYVCRKQMHDLEEYSLLLVAALYPTALLWQKLSAGM